MMTVPDQSSAGEYRRWRSVDEIASHLGVTRDTIYRWIEDRGLPAHRVGRFWKLQLGEVDAWVRAGAAAEGDPATETAVRRMPTRRLSHRRQANAARHP
jgi:excisionase family DNA binding protein